MHAGLVPGVGLEAQDPAGKLHVGKQGKQVRLKYSGASSRQYLVSISSVHRA